MVIAVDEVSEKTKLAFANITDQLPGKYVQGFQYYMFFYLVSWAARE